MQRPRATGWRRYAGFAIFIAAGAVLFRSWSGGGQADATLHVTPPAGAGEVRLELYESPEDVAPAAYFAGRGARIEWPVSLPEGTYTLRSVVDGALDERSVAIEDRASVYIELPPPK